MPEQESERDQVDDASRSPAVTTSSEPTRGLESDGHLTFEISDDGGGYDVERAPSRGTGLTNMSDRIGALGETLTVQSTPGVGTTVRGQRPPDPNVEDASR